MKAIITDVFGYSAAIVGTFLMIPQLIKTLKTKHVDDLSMLMLIVYLLNCALWLGYGILLDSIPMMLCNSIAFIIGLIQFYLKLKYTSNQ